MRQLAFIVLGAILSMPVGAQTGVLTGIVVDEEAQQPVSYASISVDSATYGASSDDNGSFVIPNLPEGSYRVDVSRIGYATRTFFNISIRPGDTTNISCHLATALYVSDEVVVTASRKAQSLQLAPASAVILSQKQFQQRQIQTFDQALDEVAGLVVTRTSGSNVQSVSIRGASETAGGGIGNRVLLLVDGRPALSPESGGALWNLVPLNSLERIEVVKGAYSALFGSSAVGGVINAISHKPSTKARTVVQVDYGAYAPPPQGVDYDLYRDFNNIGISHSKRIGKFSYLVDLARKHNDGHRAKSGFTLYNSFAKMQYEFAPNRSLTLTGNFNKQRNDTPGTWLSAKNPYEVADFKKDDYQDKSEGAVDVLYSAVTNSNSKYTSRFYYYQNFQVFTFNDDPDNDSTNVNIGKQFIDKSSIRTHRLGNISQVDLTIGNSHYALAGIDVKFDKVVALPDTVLYGRHNALELGFFVQDEWEITKTFTVTAGARLDYYNIIDEFSEFNFSPKIAAVYKPSDRLSVRALWARAFRNAAIAERFIKFEQGGGLSFEPNPDLVSEKLTNSVEVGTNILAAAGLRIDLSLYYNTYRDLISFIQVSQPLEPLTFKVVNLKTAVMQGMDVSISYRPCDWFSFRAGYGLLDARDTSPDRVNDKLAYKPRHSYSAATSVRWRRLELFVQGRGRSAIEEVFIYPDSTPDAYAVLDSKLAFSFGRSHEVFLAANNITNTQYEELERYRMPGRSFSGGFVFRFQD